MTTPNPDLELRLAVAKTMPEKFPNARIDNFGESVICDCGDALMTEPPWFDISFDAILPLVRENNLCDIKGELKKLHKQYLLKCKEVLPFGDAFGFSDWLIYVATPTDYCRAYLSAVEKGESQ